MSKEVSFFINKYVVNLSRRNFEVSRAKLISKGLVFVPRCNKINRADLKTKAEIFKMVIWYCRSNY